MSGRAEHYSDKCEHGFHMERCRQQDAAIERSALERAAQECKRRIEMWDRLKDQPTVSARIDEAEALAEIIGFLASPAAAPAAETRSAPPSRCAHGIPMDAPCMSCPTLAPGRRASAEGPVRAPPSEPAALLPRVLAALTGAAIDAASHGHVKTARDRNDLAAELRAYIAEREPAEKRVAELERLANDNAFSGMRHKARADAAEARVAQLETRR